MLLTFIGVLFQVTNMMKLLLRGQVLFDFDGQYPDLVCLAVRANEVLEVSLRDEAGWTLARRSGTEGYIPTSYFKLIE